MKIASEKAAAAIHRGPYVRVPVATIGISHRYSKNLDYLVAAVLYLGTCPDWWARTPANMARELSLDEERLHAVLEAFPALFRRRIGPSSHKTYYGLQARYAQRSTFTPDGEADDEPEELIDIPPLSGELLKLVTDVVLQSAEAERTNWRVIVGQTVTGAAAVLAAVASLYGALTGATHKASTNKPNAPISAAAPIAK